MIIILKQQFNSYYHSIRQESWQLVKQEFASLTPVEKQTWHTQALAARANAKMMKQSKKAVAKEAARAPTSGDHRKAISDSAGGALGGPAMKLSLPAPAGVPFVFNASICEADARRLTSHASSVSRFFEHLQERYAQAVSSESAMSMWPLTESNVLSALLSLKCRGRTLKDAVQQIDKTSNAVAGPRSADDRIPGKVNYFLRCPGVCLNSSNATALILYKKVVSKLHELCSGFSSAAEAIRSDMLLRISSKCGRRYSQDRYFLLAAMAFQGGDLGKGL